MENYENYDYYIAASKTNEEELHKTEMVKILI